MPKWAAEIGELFSPELGGWLAEKSLQRLFTTLLTAVLLSFPSLHYFCCRVDTGT